MMPTLSIITICRNNINGLKRTIESVIAQSFNEYEHIIIDGASTDGTIEYLSALSSNIQWISETDSGIYNAMNKGLHRAAGEWVLFLNSGDELHNSTVLSTIFPISTEADILYGDADFIYKNGITTHRKYPQELTFNFFYQSSLCHQATFYKRELLLQHGGYNETYKIIADWALSVELMILTNEKYKHLPLVCTNYYMDGISGTEKGFELVRQEREYFFKQNLPFLIIKDYHNWNDIEQDVLFQQLQQIKSKKGRHILSIFIRILKLFVK